MSIQDIIYNYLVEMIGVRRENINDDKTFFDDFGFDSLDFADLANILEEETGVFLPWEKLEGVETVGDMIRRVEEVKASR